MLPTTSQKRLSEALKKFDAELRDSEKWRDWESKRNHHFAIEHESKRYPVKQIIAMATGAARNSFGGGEESNHFVQHYGLKVVTLRKSREPRVWWVNQGKSWEQASAQGYLRAPKQDKGGTTLSHHSRLCKFEEGDVVVHYNGKVYALGLVASGAYDDPGQSQGQSDTAWKIDVDHWILEPATPYEDLKEAVGELHLEAGPVASTGDIKQGYAWQFSREGLGIIREKSTAQWPEWAEELLPDRTVDTSSISYWKIAPGAGARKWDEWLKNECATIGWEELGDLSGVDRDTFEERCREAFEKHPNWTPARVEQVWKFANIKPGSRIVANRGISRVLGIGTVTELYYFLPGVEHGHRLPVRWDDQKERVIDRGGWRKTLIRLTKADFEELVAAPSPDDPIPPQPPPETTEILDYDAIIARLENEGLHFSEEVVAKYLLALQVKCFVILSGISGTGKTQLALAIAKCFQPHIHEKTNSEEESGFPIKVRPYMLKHSNVAIPAALTKSVPGFLDYFADSNSGDFLISYPEGEQKVRFWKPPNANTVFALLSGAVRKWFTNHFKESDEIRLEIEQDPNGDPKVLSLFPSTKAGASTSRATYEVVAVRPDWTDNRGLLGFYNPITRQYSTTPFLRLLLEAEEEYRRASVQRRAPQPYFAILDEMNLARVEHYFSDFLSCLESEERLHLHDDLALESGMSEEGEAIPRRIKIPPNLFFTGTVNVDETTYMFSPKVLDRAFTLELDEVDLVNFRKSGDDVDDRGSNTPLRLGRFDGALVIGRSPSAVDWERFRPLDDGRLYELVIRLNKRLEQDHRHFGYRVATEIARFVNLAAEQAVQNEGLYRSALDVAVLSKVMPKLHGTQQELEELLARLLAFAIDTNSSPTAKASEGDWRLDGYTLVPRSEAEGEKPLPELPRTAAKLWRMMRRLRQQGFTSFIE